MQFAMIFSTISSQNIGKVLLASPTMASVRFASRSPRLRIPNLIETLFVAAFSS